jgi:hypothetical protein
VCVCSAELDVPCVCAAELNVPCVCMQLNSKAAYTLERAPSLLAEGVACATSEPLEDSLDTFHAEMSMSLIRDDHYPYFSAKPKTNKAFGGITERMSGERSFLAQSSSELPFLSKRCATAKH